jgi:hypothetical protein
LRGRIGAEAIEAWQALGDDVAVKREIIRTVAEIRLKPSHIGDASFVPHMVIWRWNFGQDRTDRCGGVEEPMTPRCLHVHP